MCESKETPILWTPLIATFILEKENELGLTVGSLITDNALEFTTGALAEFLRIRGIRHRFIAPATPTENALAERAVGVLTQTTRCLLLESALPAHFWEYALHFAVYIHNITPCSVLPQTTTPMIRWNGRLPSYGHHRTFGSIAYVVNTTTPHRFKFGPPAQRGVFIGYASHRGGYLIWMPTLNKVIVSRHVRFDEEQRIVSPDKYTTEPTTTVDQLPPVHLTDSSSSDSASSDTSDNPPPSSPPPDSPAPSSESEIDDFQQDDEEPEDASAPPPLLPEQQLPVHPLERLRTLRSWREPTQTPS